MEKSSACYPSARIIFVANARPLLTQSEKSRGAVYTPPELALWLASEVKKLQFEPKYVLDPAAGDGDLLLAIKEVFPHARLEALEMDALALSALRSRKLTRRLVARDSLTFDWRLPASKGLIFANPPWGADLSEAFISKHLTKYELAHGQFDSYDLFIEKMIREIPTGSFLALFLPETLFLPQHIKTRQLIVKNCKLRLLVRLGEGMFPGVSMGSIAMILEKGKASSSHTFTYARLSREGFKSIRSHTDSLDKALKESRIRLHQSGLSRADKQTWDLETMKSCKLYDLQLPVIHSRQNSVTWDKWFDSSRGLEMGKRGAVSTCTNCGTNRQISKSIMTVCKVCGTLLSADSTRQIVLNEPIDGAIPLIAGEDVSRFRINIRRWVPHELPGISFKDELDKRERLIVRKTGIGLQAAILSDYAATTQTVYSFTPTKASPDYAVPYVCGLIGSRVYNALHLASSGETQWRSHPYVTQNVLRSLAIQVPDTRQRTQHAEFIANMTLERQRSGIDTSSIEIEVEKRICSLLGFDLNLLEWSVKYLSAIEGCGYTSRLAQLKVPSRRM